MIEIQRKKSGTLEIMLSRERHQPDHKLRCNSIVPLLAFMFKITFVFVLAYVTEGLWYSVDSFI